MAGPTASDATDPLAKLDQSVPEPPLARLMIAEPRHRKSAIASVIVRAKVADSCLPGVTRGQGRRSTVLGRRSTWHDVEEDRGPGTLASTPNTTMTTTSRCPRSWTRRF